MDVGEAALWDGNGGGWWGNVGVDFCFLAGKAGTGPEVEVSGHVWPHKTGGNEAAGGSDSRVAKGMDVVKDLATEGKGDQGAES